MNESFCVVRHQVEGQSAGRPVQKQSQSLWSDQKGLDVNVRDPYIGFLKVVSEGVTLHRGDAETPASVTTVNFCVPVSLPRQALICNTNIHKRFPVHLPVAAPSQSLSTQHLTGLVKSLWMIRIRLLFMSVAHVLVALRQKQLFIHSVGVECEITGICERDAVS